MTRVARVTGLDRAGVEVAAAIRPGGHVLQVCNGKGETFAQAAVGALLEAAELWAAERVDPAALRWGSVRELRRGGAEAWGADEMGSAGGLAAPKLYSDDVRCAFVQAQELQRGGEVLVPAQAVHCPPAGGPPLGPALVRWSTNGSGAHPEREQALLHALLEAVERDQLARALPGGFTERAIGARRLAPEALREAAPGVAALCERLAAAGLHAHLFDLAPAGARSLGLPVAGALLLDEEHGPMPASAGYACRLRRDQALQAALREAAQSRLTDVHGARDDVAPMDPLHVRGLREAIARARAGRDPAAMADVRVEVRAPSRERARRAGQGAEADARAQIAEVLRRLRRAGHARAAAVDLSRGALEVRVVKVVVPGLRVSELL